MESTQASLKINFVVYTKVEGISPSEHSGWWVHFEGSRESIHFDGDKPFEPNDKVKITFEKVQADAIPSRSPV